jgi:hypothetical protein
MDNEELHYLYVSPNTGRVTKSRKMRWMGQVACMEEMRNANEILVRKTERKRTLRISRH